MRAQMASLAIRIFWKEPRMCILLSANTIRVLVAFSIVNLVLPFCISHTQVRLQNCDRRPGSLSYLKGAEMSHY